MLEALNQRNGITDICFSETVWAALPRVEKERELCHWRANEEPLEESRQEMSVAWAQIVSGERKRNGDFGSCFGGGVKWTCCKLCREGRKMENQGETLDFLE